MARLLTELTRIETAQLATARDRDEGLLSDRAARTRLAELRDEHLDASERMARARASAGTLAPLCAIARELLGDEPKVIPMAEVWTARDLVLDLDIDQQRETVRAMVTVQVDSHYVLGADGRKVTRPGERIHIIHKIATHLNPWEPEARLNGDQSRLVAAWDAQLDAADGE